LKRVNKSKEKEFFNIEHKVRSRISFDNFYKLAFYARKYFHELISEGGQGKDILEIGCGTGSYTFTFSPYAKKIVGIDISDTAIEIANQRARELNQNNVEFFVMDSENTAFPEDSFDLVFGNAIVHHLNIDQAMKELVRVLKPDGTAIFLEPLGNNPFIVLFRKLTPKYRSPDEHPLKPKDLSFIQSFFNYSHIKYFCLFSFLAFPFVKTKVFPQILSFLNKFDQTIFNLFPFLKKFSWITVIMLKNPAKKSKIME
jgi:ubiquinone/menaquinone biosynthesis C-methylase UbiE